MTVPPILETETEHREASAAQKVYLNLGVQLLNLDSGAAPQASRMGLEQVNKQL